MDNVNREDGISYDTRLPEPPTLAECMLDFGHVQRGHRKTLQQTIANTTVQPMIWLGHTGEVKWITLEPDHGILQPGERRSIRVTADTRALAVGEHCVTLMFSSEGDEASTSRNMLSKVKVEESSMSQGPSPTSPQVGLHLGWLTPQSTSTMALVINNPDTHPIEWDIQLASDASQAGKKVLLEHFEQPDGKWKDFPVGQYQGIILNPSEMKGTLGPGVSTTVYVTANSNPDELESETFYTTNLILTSRAAGATNAPSTSVQVPVTFYVSVHPYDDGGPKCPTGLPPAPSASITIPKSQQQGQTTLSFRNTYNNSKVYWTLNLDPGVDWLEVKPPSGSYEPGQSASVTLNAKRGNLKPGAHVTNLHLELSYHANMNHVNKIPQPIPVTVIVE